MGPAIAPTRTPFLDAAVKSAVAADVARRTEAPLTERELDDRGVRMSAVSLALQTLGSQANSAEVLTLAGRIEAFVKPPPAAPEPPPKPSIPIYMLEEAYAYIRAAHPTSLSLALNVRESCFEIVGHRHGLSYLWKVGFHEFAQAKLNPLLPVLATVARALS